MNVKVKSIMKYVAVTAILIKGVLYTASLVQLREEYRRKAAHHANLESQAVSLAQRFRPDGRSRPGLLDKMIDYHKSMKRKYLRAASRPWEAVPPEPPPPLFID